MNPIWRAYFSDGWFNHQPVLVLGGGYFHLCLRFCFFFGLFGSIYSQRKQMLIYSWLHEFVHSSHPNLDLRFFRWSSRSRGFSMNQTHQPVTLWFVPMWFCWSFHSHFGTFWYPARELINISGPWESRKIAFKGGYVKICRRVFIILKWSPLFGRNMFLRRFTFFN